MGNRYEARSDEIGIVLADAKVGRVESIIFIDCNVWREDGLVSPCDGLVRLVSGFGLVLGYMALCVRERLWSVPQVVKGEIHGQKRRRG